jgi:hypothetical protein
VDDGWVVRSTVIVDAPLDSRSSTSSRMRTLLVRLIAPPPLLSMPAPIVHLLAQEDMGFRTGGADDFTTCGKPSAVGWAQEWSGLGDGDGGSVFYFEGGFGVGVDGAASLSRTCAD